MKKPMLYQRKNAIKLCTKKNQYDVIYYTHASKKASLKVKHLHTQMIQNLIDFSP